MKLLRSLDFWASLYLLIGVIAFGHCWARSNWTKDEKDMGLRAAASFGAAIGWPLYVSTKLWEVKP